YLPNERYEDVVEEIEDYLNRVAEADVWMRENPLEFEWGGASMIEDKGEIFPSFTVPIEHPGFKQLEDAHQHVHGSALRHG
ncbi:acetylornithine deacetylase, partial [Staphylococcus warneri]